MTGDPGAFGKTRPGADPSYFAAEAAGLRWLAAVPGGPPVPRVREVSATRLVLDRVPAGAASRGAADSFGRALHRLHACGAPAYGSPPPGADRGWIADLPLPYGEWASFGPFYARARVLPYARSAADRGALDAAGLAAVEAVWARLEADDADLCGPPEPPARLHGDLWSGNVLWAPTPDGTPGAWLIDPAAHGGHRETDLAMLALFGLPHLDTVLKAYEAAAAGDGRPLAPDWRERVALHQLHPLLVHAALFGPSYGSQAAAVARRLLAG
ncbi:MAG: fructosamine kinase family protein [Candidatus Nanopelagicales bacterium]